MSHCSAHPCTVRMHASANCLPHGRMCDSDPLYGLAGRTGDAAIQQLNEQYQTYVMVEQSLLRRKASLMGKLPDIHKTLDAVNLLQKRQEADESVSGPAVKLSYSLRQPHAGALCATLPPSLGITANCVHQAISTQRLQTCASSDVAEVCTLIAGGADAHGMAGAVRVRARQLGVGEG